MLVGLTNETTRQDWVKRVLSGLPAGWRILDAGAGEQPYRQFCGHLRYVSQDFAKYDGKGDGIGKHMGKWEQQGLDIICDITSIPEPDGSFDAVLCTEVLEHLPDPLAALRELTRLLRGGGILILTAPFCSWVHFSPYFYCSGFSRNFYEHWLGVFGYEIVELKYNGNFFEFLAQELRRLRTVARDYVGQPPGWLERRAIGCLLRFLDRLSRTDQRSHELAAYGIFVRAVKK